MYISKLYLFDNTWNVGYKPNRELSYDWYAFTDVLCKCYVKEYLVDTTLD